MSAAVSLDDEVRDLDVRRAEAVALLRVTITLHERARLDLDASADALSDALFRIGTDLATYERVGAMLADVSLLVARLRDEAGL